MDFTDQLRSSASNPFVLGAIAIPLSTPPFVVTLRDTGLSGNPQVAPLKFPVHPLPLRRHLRHNTILERPVLKHVIVDLLQSRAQSLISLKWSFGVRIRTGRPIGKEDTFQLVGCWVKVEGVFFGIFDFAVFLFEALVRYALAFEGREALARSCGGCAAEWWVACGSLTTKGAC